MTMLIFLVGALLGMLAGAALCVRYLRQEITGDVGPRLRHMQLQLDNLEATLSLAIVSRYTEVTQRTRHDPGTAGR